MRHYNKNKQLDEACKSGNFTKVKELIAKGYDPNYKNPEGKISIEYIAHGHNTNNCLILQHLITNGLIMANHIKAKLINDAIYSSNSDMIRLVIRTGYSPNLHKTIEAIDNNRHNNSFDVLVALMEHFGLNLLLTEYHISGCDDPDCDIHQPYTTTLNKLLPSDIVKKLKKMKG
jgi:hypothetical protein